MRQTDTLARMTQNPDSSYEILPLGSGKSTDVFARDKNKNNRNLRRGHVLGAEPSWVRTRFKKNGVGFEAAQQQMLLCRKMCNSYRRLPWYAITGYYIV